MRFISSSLGRRLGLGGGVLIAVIAAIGVLALGASAKSGGGDILHLAKAEHVGTSKVPIAVNSKGRPVYLLHPETTKHLLCKGMCLKVWPPVTAKPGQKLTKVSGVKGRLGSFKRGATRQVTLNGHPLYTFVKDTAKGTAHGDGIVAFGGTWHVFREGPAVKKAPTTTTPTTPTTTPTTPYTSPPGY